MLQKLGDNEERIMELPPNIYLEAIRFLNINITYRVRQEFYKLHENNKYCWMTSKISNEIRKLLIENVCVEDVLPSGSWVEYIPALIEKVIGF